MTVNISNLPNNPLDLEVTQVEVSTFDQALQQLELAASLYDGPVGMTNLDGQWLATISEGTLTINNRAHA